MEQRLTFEDLTGSGTKLETGATHKVSVALDTLESTVALDQLVGFAKKRGEKFFVLWMMIQFGGDIEPERYAALHADLVEGRVKQPPIRIRLPGTLRGFLGAYNRRTRTIEVERELAYAASQGDARSSWLVLAVLFEEFGHFVDHLLRGEEGDARGDEGARFAYSLMNLGWSQQTSFTYGTYHHRKSGAESALTVSWAEYRNRMDQLVGAEEQAADDQDEEREFFGAGRLGHDNGAHAHSWGHQSIEEEILRARGVSVPHCLEIYFGNWMRDYSQALGGPLEQFMRRSFIVNVLYYVAHGELSQRSEFDVTEERIGIYHYWEHIDNPHATRDLKRGAFRFDQSTGLPVYIRNSAAFWDPRPATATGIPSALGYVCEQLEIALRHGNNADGRRHLGQALHVIEDYYAHSNFTELTLMRCGAQGAVQRACADVYPWTDFRLHDGSPPIVTGTFGYLDTAISLVLVMSEHLAGSGCTFYATEPDWKLKAAITMLGEILRGHLGPLAHSGRQTARDRQFEELWNDHVDELQSAIHWAQELGLLNEHPVANMAQTFADHTLTYLTCEIGEVISKFGAAVLAAIVNHLVRDALGHNLHFDGSAGSIARDLGTELTHLQTVVGGVGVYPTHSQIAKDHDDHPMHDLAAKMAGKAVGSVYDALAVEWAKPEGSRNASAVCTTAASFFVHPWKTTPPAELREMALEWAGANLEKVQQAGNPTWRREHEELWAHERTRARRIIGDAVGRANVDRFIDMVESWLRDGEHDVPVS